MRLKQFQYVAETEKRAFNISAAALSLNTSQPGISKQLRLLEEELGAQIFLRKRGRLVGLTPLGEEIIHRIRRVVDDVFYITSVCRDKSNVSTGALTIATTHVQACYVLPEVITRFRSRYPKVKITLRQAMPNRIPELLNNGEVDFGFTSDAISNKDLVVLPCKTLSRIVIVPKGHPLLSMRSITLKALAAYPLITYERGFKSRDKILNTFTKRGLTPGIVLSVSDADVIKTCVERGMGIGVLLEVAYDPQKDHGLQAIPAAAHLFPQARLGLMLSRNHHLRRFEFDFIEELSARWHRSRVQIAMSARRPSITAG